MILVDTLANLEEWHCETCDRRVLYQWEPYGALVVEYGDETVAHAGLKTRPQ